VPRSGAGKWVPQHFVAYHRAVDLEIFWHGPVHLREARAHEDLIYACDHMDAIPSLPGVYIFGRLFGDNVDPIYIGRATDLRRRIKQHIDTVRLMRAIKRRPNGARVVLIGQWRAKKGQQEDRALPLLEAALIKFALAEGYELVNDKGTKTAVHTISMTGNRTACKRLFHGEIKSERK
jgi:hypothetical protein